MLFFRLKRSLNKEGRKYAQGSQEYCYVFIPVIDEKVVAFLSPEKAWRLDILNYL